MTFKIILGLGLFLIIAGLYVRLAPLPAGRLTEKPGPMSPGVHPKLGGIKVVRPLETLPENAFARLLEIATATPRTERVGLGEQPAAFVTRSKLWGFPDIALIWVEDGSLHIASHLVYGKGDMGVNATKVTRWIDALSDTTS